MWSLDEIIRAIDQGRPVIVAIAGERIPLEYQRDGDWVRKSVSYDKGHWVVATGYSEEYIICNDPGRRLGHNARYQKDVFLSAMSDNWSDGDWKGAVVVVLPRDDAAQSPLIAPPSGLTTALVMDRSGSMQGEKLRRAQEAAYVYVDTCVETQDMVSLAAFDATAEGIMEPVSVETGRETLKQGILSLVSGGSTNVGSGLEVAFNHLASSSLQNKTAVLLSDGRNNSGAYEPQVAKFRGEGWPISTVAFGADADQEMLSQIAYQTGGNFFPAGLFDVSRVYHKINVQAHNGSVLRSYSEFVRPGNPLCYVIPVQPDMRTIGFFTDWQGSSMNTEVVSPSGARIGPENCDTYGRHTHGETHSLLEVQRPEPGEWYVQISGHDLPPQGEQVNFHSYCESDTVSNVLGFQQSYSPDDPVHVSVKLANVQAGRQRPLTGAAVVAEVKKPSSRLSGLMVRRSSSFGGGGILQADDVLEILQEVRNLTRRIALHDDGLHDDLEANDGIYANTYNDAAAKGPYLVTVDCDLPGSQGKRIQRRLQESFQVGEIARNRFTISDLLAVLTGSRQGGNVPIEMPEDAALEDVERIIDAVLDTVGTEH